LVEGGNVGAEEVVWKSLKEVGRGEEEIRKKLVSLSR
jgi:hypothetical protein